MADYSKSKMAAVGTYGGEKLNRMMASKYGQTIEQHIFLAIDTADVYVDYYLPDTNEQEHTGSYVYYSTVTRYSKDIS